MQPGCTDIHITCMLRLKPGGSDCSPEALIAACGHILMCIRIATHRALELDICDLYIDIAMHRAMITSRKAARPGAHTQLYDNTPRVCALGFRVFKLHRQSATAGDPGGPPPRSDRRCSEELWAARPYTDHSSLRFGVCRLSAMLIKAVYHDRKVNEGGIRPSGRGGI